MDGYDDYFAYLSRRSLLGRLYRGVWLYPTLSRRLQGRTLDIGCGIGDMLAYRSDTVGVDINPRTVSFCRSRGFEAHLMRANLLPFERGAFDSVLLDNVIEHIADPAPLLAEVRRVLREHGWFLVGVPGKKGWDSDPDHKVRYDKDLLIRVVRGAGFMHRETFFMPVGHSDWMDQHIRQYCLYSLFQRDTEYLISSA